MGGYFRSEVFVACSTCPPGVVSAEVVQHPVKHPSPSTWNQSPSSTKQMWQVVFGGRPAITACCRPWPRRSRVARRRTRGREGGPSLQSHVPCLKRHSPRVAPLPQVSCLRRVRGSVSVKRAGARACACVRACLQARLNAAQFAVPARSRTFPRHTGHPPRERGRRGRGRGEVLHTVPDTDLWRHNEQ